MIQEAGERLALYGQKTVVFLDEIHRFNKAQQDALLPAVEDGTILLIGATTENPYYELNAPLLSRCRLFRLSPLKRADVEAILRRALADRENGLGEYKVELTAGAMEHLLDVAGGDARTALNGLELAVLSTGPADDGIRYITPEIIEESVQQKIVRYDKNGDEHYNTVSAFIKSLRGSDRTPPSFTWRMLAAGEDPRFIARRMIIAAAEDVGTPIPRRWWWRCGRPGLGDGGAAGRADPLAQAAVYLATAPKSNAAYLGIDRAMADVESKDTGEIPLHLRDASIRGQGHGPRQGLPLPP